MTEIISATSPLGIMPTPTAKALRQSTPKSFAGKPHQIIFAAIPTMTMSIAMVKALKDQETLHGFNSKPA